MNKKLEVDIRESITYFLNINKDSNNFLNYTYPWSKKNVIKKLALKALLEIFQDFKVSELIDYHESLAYCLALIELSCTED